MLLNTGLVRAHAPKVVTPFGSFGLGSPTNQQAAPPRN